MATKYQKIALVILLLGLAVAMTLVNMKQDVRKRASGAGGVATLALSPSSSTVASGATVTHDISINTAGVPISTFGFRLNYPLLPVLTIKPEFNSNGWSCPIKTVTLVNTQYQVDVSCVFISTEGFSTATPVTVASVNTTASSSFTVEFDALQTLITRKSDAADIAAIPASPASVVTVAIAAASPTPTPTPTPNPTPTPTPTPFPTANTSSEIKDDFNGSLDVSKWNLLKYPSGAPIQSQIKDQAFTHYIAGLKENIAAVADTKPVSGDFDVSADLKINSSNTSYSTVDLIFHDDSWKNMLGITISNLGGVYGFSSLDSKQVNTDIKTGLSNPLTVRVIRIGNNVYYYYKSSLGYTLLGSFAGIYTGRGNFALQTTTNKPDYPDITGTFDNFVAKVNEIAPSPTPGATNACGGTCGSNNNCNAGLVCYSGFCRNPQCKENSDCNCASAQAPSPTPKANTNTSKPTPTPYKTVVDLKPTPTSSTKPTPKTDMRIYNLDLETPAPAPVAQKQSFFGRIVGFFLKLFGIKY